MMDVYEREIEALKIQLSRINNYSSILNSRRLPFDPSFSQWRLANKLLNEYEQRQVFSNQIKQDFIRIHSLVSEANRISNEMQQKIIYNVILQIPISYLKPNERVCLIIFLIKIIL
jgi:hypothetical protein